MGRMGLVGRMKKLLTGSWMFARGAVDGRSARPVSVAFNASDSTAAPNAIHYFMNTATKQDHETTDHKTTDKAPTLCVVTSLSEVINFHKEPIAVKIFAYGRLLQFKGRRLLPSEADEVRTLLKRAIPPRNDKGEYDFDNAEYRTFAHHYQLQARAQTLWLAFDELFRAQAQAMGAKTSNLQEITAFIQSLPMADEALETLFGAATAEPVSLVELTGFTSGNPSPTS